MQKHLLFALLFATTLTHAESMFKFSNSQGPYAVGLQIVQQYDYSRAYHSKYDAVTGNNYKGEQARPIQTVIWYPAEKAGSPVHYVDYLHIAATEQQFDLGSQAIEQTVAEVVQQGASPTAIKQALSQAMWAVRDAKPITGKFPLVVYAPSFSAPAIENVELCEYLASQGYVVIASPNMGPYSRPMIHTVEGVETQATDIEFLIGYAHSLPQVEFSKIAVIGFSWGGISNVFAAAKDTRITALVSLDGSVRYSPELITASKYVTPARVAAPLLYIGTRGPTLEQLADPKIFPEKLDTSFNFLNRMKYSDRYQVTMSPMIHPYFSSLFLRISPENQFVEYSRDEVSLAYSWVARYVHEFLNAYLKSDAAGKKFLNATPVENAVPAHLLAVDKHLAESVQPTLDSFAVELGKRGFENALVIYQTMQKQDGDFKIEELELNHWGLQLLSAKRYKESIQILKLATQLFPDSWNTYDSLAYAYETTHDKPLAIENYRKSLKLEPKNFNAVQHLKDLGSPTDSLLK